jgi:hypothetical protein
VRQRAVLVLRYFEDLTEAQTVGYLDSGLNCVPLQVSVPGRPPIRVGLSAHGGTCAV